MGSFWATILGTKEGNVDDENANFSWKNDAENTISSYINKGSLFYSILGQKDVLGRQKAREIKS